MIIYLLLVATILLMNYLMKADKVTKKQFCVTLGCIFVLITGLRSVNVGSDTTVYYLDFIHLKKLSFDALMALNKRDVAFYILSWFVGKTTGSFVVLTLITAVVFYYPVMKMIYKYSDDCGLSCLILLAFNFFQFSMTGMRQTIAFGFVLLFFLALHEEETSRLKTLCFLALGILFHRSSLMALLYLLIKPLSKNRTVVKLFALGIPVFFLLRTTLLGAMSGFFELIGFDSPENEQVGAGMTTFLVYLLLVVAGFFLGQEEEENTLSSSELLLCTVFATALQSFVLVNGVFFRVAWYFAIFFPIYMPRLLSKAIFARQDLKVLGMFAYFAMLFMYLGITIGSATVLPYEFFWQG